MVTLSRKQREIQQREAQILELARPIVLSEGFQALSMERLAVKMEFAKGTLYNHFRNKEEIVAALALESMQLRNRLFEAASASSSQSRQRMAAIGCMCDMYSSQFPQHFAIEQLMRNSVIWQKASEQRQESIQNCEQQCMAIVSGIVRDAVASGDLELPDEMTAEELVFGFWSLIFGSQVLIATSPSLSSVGINDPVRSIRFHAWTLMNGFAWQPMMSFAEAEAFMQSVAEKVLADVS